MCCPAGQSIHNIPFRYLPSIRDGVTVLWLENLYCSLSPSNASNETVDRLRTLNNHHILHYTTVSKCLKYLKRTGSFERVIIVMVMNDASIVGKTSITAADVSRFHHYQQVQSIFIVSLAKEIDDNIMINFSKNARVDDITKVVGVYRDYQSMFVQLQQLLDETEEHNDELFTTFNQREKSLRDVDHELVILAAMPYNSSQAKQEMLAECRARCRGNHYELTTIDEFEHTYRSANAIYWYTRTCFLYRVINKALRTQDAFVPYIFRYFIVDVCDQLEKLAVITRASHTTPFCVYRGAKCGRDEVEQLHVDMLVAPNGFFSSSKRLQVAQEFISIDSITGMSPSRSRKDIRQYVLFEIDIDLISSSDLIIADISGQSAIPDEKEMMFGLGTTFQITHISYDVEHYVWNVKMVSSSKVAQLSRDYNNYISRRLTEVNATILFGSVMATISGEYVKTMTYFQRMLQKMPANDEDRPNIYYQLARVYRYMTKYQKAIEYFRRAQLLQRSRLPQSNFEYARTLSELGNTYSELGDSARAIKLLTKAMIIHRRLLSDNHFEMAVNSNRLAYAYWQEKEYERALVLLSNALSFFKQKMPTDHPCHAQTLHTMGLVQRDLGKWQPALDYLTEALRMRESLLADDHLYVAQTCYELSVLYTERSDKKIIALDYAQRALRIRKAKLSPDSDDLKQSIKLFEQLSQQITK